MSPIPIDLHKLQNMIRNNFYLQINELSKKNKFEDEIRQEQEERKRSEEEKSLRRQDFLQKAALFK